MVSAADSGKLWDLRCEIRESLLRFMQERHPEGLPRMRVERVEGPAQASARVGARLSAYRIRRAPTQNRVP